LAKLGAEIVGKLWVSLIIISKLLRTQWTIDGLVFRVPLKEIRKGCLCALYKFVCFQALRV